MLPSRAKTPSNPLTWIVIYDAFLVLNEMQTVSETLTLTWIEKESFDDSFPFPSPFPSLKFFLEMAPWYLAQAQFWGLSKYHC